MPESSHRHRRVCSTGDSSGGDADGLTLHKPKHCMFRGYQIHISHVESSQTEVRARTTDFRYKDTDLAVILRDGRYKLEKAENGKWSVSEYVPVATPTGR